jgi:hypothetical protein
MFDRVKAFCAPVLLAIALGAGSGAAAQDAAWQVSKSSGDVLVTTSDGQQSPLATGATLKPGDNVRTGQNGRVLLTRGAETILISPNSVIGLPAGSRSGLSTTIVEQMGSILLEVEKKNVKHFQVETPYLAAVVKGTQFRVTVSNSESHVDVLRGQVEVTDFKSGQFALVMPGQAADVSVRGTAGLSLSGSGALSPIQQGMPRMASVSPLQLTNDTASGASVVSGAPNVSGASAASSAPTASGASTVVGSGGSNAQKDSDMPAAPKRELPTKSRTSSADPALLTRDAAMRGTHVTAGAAQDARPSIMQSSHSGQTSPSQSAWSSLTAWRNNDGHNGGPRHRQSDAIAAAAVSCAVGFIVAIGVGAVRRRKSKKSPVKS